MQYGAAGENMSLEKIRRQHFSSFIQCVNASDNQGDGNHLVSVQENMVDGTFLQIHIQRLVQHVTCEIVDALSCKSRGTWVNFPRRFFLTATSSLPSKSVYRLMQLSVCEASAVYTFIIPEHGAH